MGGRRKGDAAASLPDRIKSISPGKRNGKRVLTPAERYSKPLATKSKYARHVDQ